MKTFLRTTFRAAYAVYFFLFLFQNSELNSRKKPANACRLSRRPLPKKVSPFHAPAMVLAAGFFVLESMGDVQVKQTFMYKGNVQPVSRSRVRWLL